MQPYGLLRCASSHRPDRRLAPAGLPSLTQFGQTGGAGWNTRRPFPVPEDRGPCFLHAARERGPLGELTGLQVAALRPARCGDGQIATPVTAKPEAGPLNSGVQRTARSGSTAAPVAALGVTSAAGVNRSPFGGRHEAR